MSSINLCKKQRGNLLIEEWKDEYIKCLNGKTCQDLKIKESFYIVKSYIPNSLFRFRPLTNIPENNEYEFNNLETNKIWLSNPNTFNDPYDSKPLFNKEYFLKMLGKQYLKYGEKLVKSLKEMAESNCDYFRIGCFTENDYSNILMWSHYANSHQGFCLRYDYASVNENIKECFYHDIKPVLYSEKIFDLSEHFITMLKSAESNKNAEKKIYFNNLIFYAIVLYKSVYWEYEKEWRMVKETRLHMIENLTDVPQPSAIYIGTNTSEENEKRLITIAQKNKIQIYKMERKNDNYKLIANEI